MEDASLPTDTDNVDQASVQRAKQTSGEGTSRHESRREKKLGHRRVDEEGTVTYKKKSSREIMNAIQLGIFFSTSQIQGKEKRDVLLTDFGVIETISFPKDGGTITPKHPNSDFKFKVYAPYAFRHFRELFGVDTKDFMHSLCTEHLKELSNPGASGSIFYITRDDEFIIKTVQHKEASFLRKLLPEYYMNLNQNPRTLLPKFYGLFCYTCAGKNIRFIIMNNLLPSSITMHEKYDLKGSTFKRAASSKERGKSFPTLKDLDFREQHPDGLNLEAYEALLSTIERDCRVLESFRIMDYSLLLGVHNLDVAKKDREVRLQERQLQRGAAGDSQTSVNTRKETTPGPRPISAPVPSTLQKDEEEDDDDDDEPHPDLPRVCSKESNIGKRLLQRSRSARQRIALFSTAMESIQAHGEPVELEKEEAEWVPPGGIPARNQKGERLLLFVGIIDILQNYRFLKKMEHRVKSIAYDGDTISVHNPSFYKERFQLFFKTVVFHQVPSLDEPEILGPNAQRFRRLVHLAMRSQAAKRRAAASVAGDASAFAVRPRFRTASIDSGPKKGDTVDGGFSKTIGNEENQESSDSDIDFIPYNRQSNSRRKRTRTLPTMRSRAMISDREVTLRHRSLRTRRRREQESDVPTMSHTVTAV